MPFSFLVSDILVTYSKQHFSRHIHPTQFECFSNNPIYTISANVLSFPLFCIIFSNPFIRKFFIVIKFLAESDSTPGLTVYINTHSYFSGQYMIFFCIVFMHLKACLVI